MVPGTLRDTFRKYSQKEGHSSQEVRLTTIHGSHFYLRPIDKDAEFLECTQFALSHTEGTVEQGLNPGLSDFQFYIAVHEPLLKVTKDGRRNSENFRIWKRPQLSLVGWFSNVGD